jgi:hypothetical protein
MAQTIDVDERRARLATRHHLAKPVTSVDTVAGDLVGLHSSDPASVFLSCWARVKKFEHADLERALYDERSLVRMLGMRRTMFVVPAADAGLLDAACAQALAPAQRRLLISLVESQGVARDGAKWLSVVERKTLDALHARGEATATQLTADVPELAGKLSFGAGKTWAGTAGLSTRVLFLLATEARIVRGRPLGSWISSQYRWAPIDRWLPNGVPALPTAEARAELVRRWLRTYGPGTLTDIKLVDRLDFRRDECGIAGRRRHRGRRRRRDGVRPRRRRTSCARLAVGRVAPRTRLDCHGLEAARVVPRGSPAGALRSQRKRGPDRVVQRPHRGWMGASS